MTKIINQDDITIIVPEGRIDTTTSKAFTEDLESAKGDIKNFIISFEDVEYISSAGLRSIIVFSKYVSGIKGKIALCKLSQGINDVFTSSGFNKIITILPNIEESKKFIGS